MNATFGNIAVKAWKSLKLQHISALFGLAIAVSAAIAIGASEGDSAPSPLQSRVPSAVGQPPNSTSPELLHIYTFGSQQDADLFSHGLSSQTTATVTTGIETIVLATPEQESVFAEAMQHWMDAGRPFRVVDLRSR